MGVRRWLIVGGAAMLAGCTDKEEGQDSGDVAATCDEREADIQGQITAAGHCESDEDCVDAGSVCPFGCAIPVHRDEVDAISAQIDAWLEDCATCDYGCAPAQDLQCQEGACVAIF